MKTKKQTETIDPALSVSGRDLTGLTVLVKAYTDPCGLFTCMGGVGCNPATLGNAIIGRWLSDGDTDRVERYQVVREATPDEIAQAEAFAARPAPERMLAQLTLYAGKVEQLRDELGRKRRRTVRELEDAVDLLYREHGRLWAILNSPDGGQWTDDGKPVGPTLLTRYCERTGEIWDRHNKIKY